MEESLLDLIITWSRLSDDIELISETDGLLHINWKYDSTWKQALIDTINPPCRVTDKLFGYILRCIKARNWKWVIEVEQIDKLTLYKAQVRDVSCSRTTYIKALLSSYCAVLKQK